jgi:hypothetical protein
MKIYPAALKVFQFSLKVVKTYSKKMIADKIRILKMIGILLKKTDDLKQGMNVLYEALNCLENQKSRYNIDKFVEKCSIFVTIGAVCYELDSYSYGDTYFSKVLLAFANHPGCKEGLH